MSATWTEYQHGVLDHVSTADGWPTAIPEDRTDGNYQVTADIAPSATTITIGNGAGAIRAGDIVMFAGHATQYVVATDLAAGSLTIAGGLTDAVASGAAVTLLAGLQTILCRENGAVHPAGSYRVVTSGIGSVSFGFDAAEQTFAGGVAGSIDVSPSPAGILVQVTATAAGSPIQFDVYLPGFTERSPKFHPVWLSQVRTGSAIRVMDWLKINGDSDWVGSSIEDWTDRPPAGYYTTDHLHGLAWEEVCDAANAAGVRTLWVCVPHRATNVYVRALAALLRARLDPGIRVIVEFSNETWNGRFQQNGWCAAFAASRGITGQPHVQAWLGGAERAIEVHAEFMAEWSDASDRVIRVLGCQAANSGLGSSIDLMLNHEHSIDSRIVGSHIDAIASAPYFGTELGTDANGPTTRTWTVEQVLDYCDNEIRTTVAGWMAGIQAHADQWGVIHLAYECGQHLAATTPAQQADSVLTDLLIAANRAPGMRDLYRLYLRLWYLATGGQLAMIFQLCGLPNQYGSWGHIESQGQDPSSAPKWLEVAAVEGLYVPATGSSRAARTTATVGGGGAQVGQSIPIVGRGLATSAVGAAGDVGARATPVLGVAVVISATGAHGGVTALCVPVVGVSRATTATGVATVPVAGGPVTARCVSLVGTGVVSGGRYELGPLPGVCDPLVGFSFVGASVAVIADAVLTFADLMQADARRIVEIEGEGIRYYAGGTGPGRDLRAYINRQGGLDTSAPELIELRGPEFVLMVLRGFGGIESHSPHDEADIPLTRGGPKIRVRLPRLIEKTGGFHHLEVQR